MCRSLTVGKLLTLLIAAVGGNALAYTDATYKNEQFREAMEGTKCDKDALKSGVTFNAFERDFPIPKGSTIHSAAGDESTGFEISRSEELQSPGAESGGEIERAIRTWAAKQLLITYYLNGTDDLALMSEELQTLEMNGLVIRYRAVEGGHGLRTTMYQVLVRDRDERGELHMTAGSMEPIAQMLACGIESRK